MLISLKLIWRRWWLDVRSQAWWPWPLNDAELIRELCALVRENMAALGHPVPEASDEQIVAGVEAFARAVANSGLSADEVAERLRSFAQSVGGEE